MNIGKDTRLLIGFGVALLVLLLRLFQIQVIDGSYKSDAANQAMYRKTIYPSRGIIYDRNGTILVGNKITYDLMVTPREIREPFDTALLAEILQVDTSFIKEKFRYYRKYRTATVVSPP